MKVAIIGGGVMGCATALALSDRGADVIVLERAIPGAEASSAAAGILGAQVELHGREEELTRFTAARQAWRSWAEALRQASGIDVGYRVSGVLKVARNETERAELASEVQWQAARGLRAELLDA
ncbi:MAG: FAD-binding oxidoreductase, partial [Myxococcota bacterium]|nr:FAD-binding oxidoreductase [Myxococcota bacterium]